MIVDTPPTLPVTIRLLEPSELPLCIPLGQAFHAEFQLPGRLDPDVFIQNWTHLLSQCRSVIYSAWRDEVLIGGLGATIIPDLLDARPVAQEMFWFIAAEHRHGTAAMRLLGSFEAWAEVSGATEKRVAHFPRGPGAERLAALYARMGYRLEEMNYVKSCYEGG